MDAYMKERVDGICSVLTSHRIVESEYTDNSYFVMDFIGQGGFGVAFAAKDMNEDSDVCLKVTADQDSWHQEAYFGNLLHGNSRVIQLLDKFPYRAQLGKHSYSAFVLVFEYAPNGCVGEFLKERGSWPEGRARREIMALLKVLTVLHAGGTLHRDITPGNVLVSAKGNLKLHDFGIARQQLLGSNVPADAFAPAFVSQIKQEAGRRSWLIARSHIMWSPESQIRRSVRGGRIMVLKRWV